VAIAERALAADHDRSGGDHYQVVVHIDHDTLRHDDEEGGCTLDDGPALATETARRLACDGSVLAMSERGGEPIAAGRKTRTVRAALRRALRARDRGCRFPGCENHLFVDAHHIEHWARGGATELDNLVLLCRRHHRLLHEGGYTMDRDGRVFDPWGCELVRVPQPPPGDPARIPRPRESLHSAFAATSRRIAALRPVPNLDRGQPLLN
jgi:hypothetical protein